MKKLLTSLFIVFMLFWSFASPAFAKCDGWADVGAEHRNAGNGCFYRCGDSGWNGPTRCDGKGNGQFQSVSTQAPVDREQQAQAVARRNEEARVKLLEQGEEATKLVASQTQQQRQTEAVRQQAMVETQRQQEVEIAERFHASPEEIAQINSRYQQAAQVVSVAQGTDRGLSVVGSGAQNAANIAASGYDPTGALGTGKVSISNGQITSQSDRPASAPSGGGSGSAQACPQSEGVAGSKGPGESCCRGGVVECKVGSCVAPGNGLPGVCGSITGTGAQEEIPADLVGQARQYEKLVQKCELNIEAISNNGCQNIAVIKKRLESTENGRRALALVDDSITAERGIYATTARSTVQCGSYDRSNANATFSVNSQCLQSQGPQQQLASFCSQYPDRCAEARANVQSYSAGLTSSLVVENKQAQVVSERVNDFTKSRQETCNKLTGTQKVECLGKVSAELQSFYAPYVNSNSTFCQVASSTCSTLAKEKDARAAQALKVAQAAAATMTQAEKDKAAAEKRKTDAQNAANLTESERIAKLDAEKKAAEKKKKDEEAKKKADDEAKKKADAEAKRKADAEALRIANEQATKIRLEQEEQARQKVKDEWAASEEALSNTYALCPDLNLVLRARADSSTSKPCSSENPKARLSEVPTFNNVSYSVCNSPLVEMNGACLPKDSLTTSNSPTYRDAICSADEAVKNRGQAHMEPCSLRVRSNTRLTYENDSYSRCTLPAKKSGDNCVVESAQPAQSAAQDPVSPKSSGALGAARDAWNNLLDFVGVK